ncbi:MAG: hypothetical protein DI630_00525 [Gordonia sp. (in: high G+C Gram-positive bacteria)]|nr:MAG: hypothetical protein DI630_00525 [Gordonia sp. (in: high G+C Gram-positive bacteria)]
MAERTAQRTQFLSGVLSCAIEGGIKHWAGVAEYQWEGLETTTGARATIHEPANDNSDPIVHVIDVDVIARGITAIASGRTSYANSGYRADRGLVTGQSHARLRRLNASNGADCELGDHDSDDADAIVQAGLFGEVRYR